MSQSSETRIERNRPCKRRYARFDTSFPGTLRSSDGVSEIECSVVDISLVGARLVTQGHLDPGSIFTLEFAGKRRKTVHTEAHVRHSMPCRETGKYITGLQLTPATFEDRKSIAEFVSLVFMGLAGN